ncbi:MAG: hypothetical protein K9H14_00545 [Actinomycetia bacterium]|nr:hypothetical protein [Actinomycetes bacterium]
MAEFIKYFEKSEDPVLVIDSRKHTAQINNAMCNLLAANHLHGNEKLTVQNVKSLLNKAIADKEKQQR